MTPSDLIKSGDVPAATAAAVDLVRRVPGDLTARITLFELLAVTGEWDRAAKHLDVVLEKSPTMVEGIASYRGALQAERERAALFGAGTGAPQQLTAQPFDPGPTLAALHHALAGRASEAAEAAAAALDATEPAAGTLDGQRFEDLRDADDLLAPYLEAISNGRYGWIPISQLRRVEFEAPRFLRDLLWRPATITLADGLSARMFVPVRYYGSAGHADPTIQLGRATDWIGDPGPVRGIGQRAFAVDGDLRYLLDLTVIAFDG